MSHLMDRCDMIDVLEASVKLRRAVTVELKNGHKFVDHAKDVVTEPDGPEWVQFHDHDRVIVDDIVFCAPADPPSSSSYDAKL
jgi:transcriptional antiterminator Rof (Rho-off)